MQVLQAQLGALVNLRISTMMGQSQTALMIFSAEHPLFLREYATNHYSIFPYVGSHLMTEVLQSFAGVFVQSIIVFYLVGFQQGFLQYLAVSFALSMTVSAMAVWLGAMFSDPKIATSMFTPVLVPQFYFSVSIASYLGASEKDSLAPWSNPSYHGSTGRLSFGEFDSFVGPMGTMVLWFDVCISPCHGI